MNRGVTTTSEYMKVLQQMRPFTAYLIDEATDELVAHMRVEGSTLIPAVSISEFDLGGQCERVTAEVAWWSRLEAQCERVVQHQERKYAIWKSRFRLDHAADEHPATGKKVTVAQLEDLYRCHEEYTPIHRRLEEVKEAAHSCKGVVAAFRAKRENLHKWVWRASDQSLTGMSI
jgi:hypothetical protein